MATDAPKISATMKDLDAEVTPVGPFVFPLKDSSRIVFPDMGELDWIETDKFYSDLDTVTNNRQFFEKWLSAEDYKSLTESGLTGNQINALGKLVMEHYQAAQPKNSEASQTS